MEEEVHQSEVHAQVALGIALRKESSRVLACLALGLARVLAVLALGLDPAVREQRRKRTRRNGTHQELSADVHFASQEPKILLSLKLARLPSVTC